MDAHDGLERPLSARGPSQVMDDELFFPRLGAVMWRYRRAIGLGLVGVAAAHLSQSLV